MKKLLTLLIMALTLGSLAAFATGCKDAATKTDGVVTTDTGLQYKDTVVGKGQTAKKGDRLSMHYTGTLDDGTKFDSSHDRNEPFEFILGIGQVIQGWDEGVTSMNVGGKRELVIPAKLGYGEMGVPGVIPGGATMHFEVELLEIL